MRNLQTLCIIFVNSAHFQADFSTLNYQWHCCTTVFALNLEVTEVIVRLSGHNATMFSINCVWRRAFWPMMHFAICDNSSTLTLFCQEWVQRGSQLCAHWHYGTLFELTHMHICCYLTCPTACSRHYSGLVCSVELVKCGSMYKSHSL